MLTGSIKTRQRLSRTTRSAALAEFGPALIILVAFVVVPLLDLTIIPVRWMLAQSIVDRYARKLAICETFRQSIATMEADPSLETQLRNLGGISIDSIDLHLRIIRLFNPNPVADVLVINEPRKIPPDWLPNGKKAPCSYVLELDVRSKMAPAILFRSGTSSIPGLTAPLPLLITASHPWQNFGRNPATGNYFINE